MFSDFHKHIYRKHALSPGALLLVFKGNIGAVLELAVFSSYNCKSMLYHPLGPLSITYTNSDYI